MAKSKFKNTPGSGSAVYVGPEYRIGISIPERRELVNPKAMDEAQRAAFVEAHPKYSAWWNTSGIAPVAADDTPDSDDPTTPE